VQQHFERLALELDRRAVDAQFERALIEYGGSE